MRTRKTRFAAVVLAGAMLAPSACRAADAGVIFERANSLYEEGDYGGAIDQYGQLVRDGIADATLYYNLGNAYYKNDELGEAVLFYERALRRSPRDQDIRHNLGIVRSQLKDNQFVRNQNRVVRGVIWLHNNLSTGEMVAVASASYVLLCLFGIAFVFRETAQLRAAYRRLSLLSPGRLFGLTMGQDLMAAMALLLFLFATTATSSYGKISTEEHRREAVVLNDEISVFGSPTEDATLQFKIHEGTLVTIRESRGEWVRVQLPGRLTGWALSNALERI